MPARYLNNLGHCMLQLAVIEIILAIQMVVVVVCVGQIKLVETVLRVYPHHCIIVPKKDVIR